ncbi:MAG TPA: hydroxymethylbilane synthase [Bacteroidota bacterium]|nr:hydroxymethylbilane synthase [Bacteroidota bacterium]
MKRRSVVLGTRGSELARLQTSLIARLLTDRYPELSVEAVHIKTTGDRILDSPLSKIGDKGLFTKEIESALLEKRIDLAVHSLKDLPTFIPAGLAVAAVTKREDVRDVFIAHPGRKFRALADVPQAGKIATGSLRRKCQLLNLRPDLEIVDLRGNLHTRREKLERSDWDGMLLAFAGVKRLGWEKMIAEILPVTRVLPAVGQGALAVEAREKDDELMEILRPFDDLETRRATDAERALLRRLEGGCQIPIGAHGRFEDGMLKLDAMVGSLDGKRMVRGSVAGRMEDGTALGVKLAEQLIEQGADKILDEIRHANEGTTADSAAQVDI